MCLLVFIKFYFAPEKKKGLNDVICVIKISFSFLEPKPSLSSKEKKSQNKKEKTTSSSNHSKKKGGKHD